MGYQLDKNFYYYNIFQFYVVVGLLTQSKTFALGNKYMAAFFFLRVVGLGFWSSLLRS